MRGGRRGLDFGGQPVTQSGMLRCPTCDASLAHTETAGMTVDTCAACGGAWFDRGELEAHLSRPEARSDVRGAAVPTSRGPAYRRCPRCAAPMTPRNWERYSGVVVDVCARHGVWVDGGELGRLHLWMDSPKRERVDAREAERERAARRHASLGTDLSPRAENHAVGSWGAFVVELVGDLAWWMSD